MFKFTACGSHSAMVMTVTYVRSQQINMEH